MEEATRQHFFHHGKSSRVPQHERDNCHWCQLRSFQTAAQFPVTVINKVDDAVISPRFRFIESNVLLRGVEVADEEFRSGCQCENDQHCQYSTCLCLEDMDDSSISSTGKIYAYHTSGAKAGLLRSKRLLSREPIYECHQGCSCSADCPNRVIERGRQIPLQIFRTTDRGWGVRCPVDIQKGQFIDHYLGEVMTPAEAHRRRKASNHAKRKDVYLFALDKFYDPESQDPRLRTILEVDGEFKSGPTRFINHSCEPNLRIFARVGDHADKHIHDLALFAIKDIPSGTELTFDYVDGDDGDARDVSMHGEMTKCLCGSKKCRGYLW